MTPEDIEIFSGGARLSMRLRMPNGLHARPAARLAREAQGFHSDILIQSEEAEADAKSMLDVLSLSLACDSDITIEARGDDAREAVAAVVRILEETA